MSLQEVQSLLAKLYTDTTLREAFAIDPQGTGRAHGLSHQEIEQLQQLSASMLASFAHSLLHKRLNEVQKLLNKTHGILGATFSRHFHAYAETYIPAGVRKHKDDAIHFATYLEEHLTLQEHPSWLAELLAYEVAWIEVQRPEMRWLMRSYRYPVHHIHRDTEGTHGPRRTLIAWWRLGKQAKLRWRVLL